MKLLSNLVTMLVVLILAGCSQAVSQEGKAVKSAQGPVAVTADNFKSEVENTDGIVIVDFWASWCGPCRAIAPIMEDMVKEYDGKLKVCKVDVDRNRELAQRFKVQGIPYLVMYKNGKMVDAKVGAAPKSDYVEWVNRYM